MLRIVCIIPSSGNTQSSGHLARCLRTLRAEKNLPLEIIRIVISDNQTLATTLRKHGPSFTFLKSDRGGFSELNNAAIAYALRRYKPDYVLFINDDARVKKSFFQKFFKENGADIIVPLIYTDTPPLVDSFGVEYFASGYAKNSIDLDTPTTLASAACLLVKASFLKKIKRAYGFYFNPRLHYYLEDVEFMIRAKALGATVAKNASLIAYHTGSATSGKKSRFTMYQTYRNILWLIIMTWPRSTVVKHLRQIFLVQGWIFLFGTWSHGGLLYPRIILDTLVSLGELLWYRRRTIRSYPKNFDFESLFSPYAFRTYHGITIK